MVSRRSGPDARHLELADQDGELATVRAVRAEEGDRGGERAVERVELGGKSKRLHRGRLELLSG